MCQAERLGQFGKTESLLVSKEPFVYLAFCVCFGVWLERERRNYDSAVAATLLVKPTHSGISRSAARGGSLLTDSYETAKT